MKGEATFTAMRATETPVFRPGDLQAAERILAQRLVERIEARGCVIWFDPADRTIWIDPSDNMTVELQAALEAYAGPVRDFLVSRRQEAAAVP